MWNREQISMVRGGVIGSLMGSGIGGSLSGVLATAAPALHALGSGQTLPMVASGLYMGAVYGGLVGSLVGGLRASRDVVMAR